MQTANVYILISKAGGKCFADDRGVMKKRLMSLHGGALCLQLLTPHLKIALLLDFWRGCIS